MSTRHRLQALLPAARAAGWGLLCCAALTAHAVEPGSPLSGSYNPWSDPKVIGQSRWSLGLVSEPRYVPPWASAPDSRYAPTTNLMLGMNLSRSGSARLVWYAPVAQPRYNGLSDPLPGGQALDPNGEPLPTPLRMGLVLRPADPWSNLRQGALTKLELSGNMALSLRPKGGGVWLALSGHW